MEVNVKDRDECIEYLRMALAMCEFGVSYKQAALIFQVANEVANLHGDFSTKDAARIFCKWKELCERYDREAEEKDNSEQP